MVLASLNYSTRFAVSSMRQNTLSTQSLTQWLSRLVQIPSVTPSQACLLAGVAGEAAMAKAVAGFFKQLGASVSIQEVQTGRDNVIGYWQGTSDRLIAVDVHMDTVGVQHMTDPPFDGRCEDGKVFGRGAVDTKATLAVVLAMLEAIQKQGRALTPSLLVAATVDEEVGATGAPALAMWLNERGMVVDQLAVAEPTMCRPVFGHKGVVRTEFHIKGKAAHSSQPQQGHNALLAAAKIIDAMDQENHRLQAMTINPDNNPLGPGTLTPTRLHAGEGDNIVPSAAILCVDRRVTAGEDIATIKKQLIEIAQNASPLPVDAKQIVSIGSFARDPESPWVKQLAQWAGMEPGVVSYGTNAWAYGQDVAKECIVIGPGSIDQAHSKTEWVTLAELSRLADIYAQWWELSS